MLGGWEFQRPPEQRAVRLGKGVTELLSVGALVTAAAIAVAALFLTRGDPAPFVIESVASPATAASPASANVESSAPQPESGATAPELPIEPASAISPATSPTTSSAAVAPAVDRTQQAAIDSVTIEAAASAGQRVAATANMPEAEQQIRSYLGLSATAALPAAFVYTVERGDTVSKLASRFGLQEATIRFNNFEIYDPDLLEIGATLNLPVRDGVIYVVQGGDNLTSVSHNYDADVEATVAFAGNGLRSADEIWVGQTLLLVGGSASVASGSFVGEWSMPSFGWPMAVTQISTYFGAPRANSYGYHTGVDWPAPYGTLIGSTAGGVVSFAGWDGGYGYWVEVDHGGGVRSRYAHLSEIFVGVGEWLEAGSLVGGVGISGNSSGAHLHFEIIMNGQPVDPYRWLQ